MEEVWLRCALYPGQFTSELAVVVKTYNGKTFSLFAQKVDLRYDRPPSEEEPADGWIKVRVVQQEGELLLVRLPQTTLENGPYLTVTAGQLNRVPEVQQV